MIEYNARERRFHGTLPYPVVYYMSSEEEVLIATEVIALSKTLDVELFALNVCRDHMHLLVYCAIEEIPKFMQRIKGRTARVCNAHRASKGIDPLDGARGIYNPRTLKDGSIPFWTQKYHCKPIRSTTQLANTLAYIRNNRLKHQLPLNEGLDVLVKSVFILNPPIH
jgi:REP element-mobilizing transposase RayT